MAAEPTKEIQVQIGPDCKGVTSWNGDRHTYADRSGRVTVDAITAEMLIRDKVATPSRRLFGGCTLPTPPREA